LLDLAERENAYAGESSRRENLLVVIDAPLEDAFSRAASPFTRSFGGSTVLMS
jgi:hypothetical protein